MRQTAERPSTVPGLVEMYLDQPEHVKHGETNGDYPGVDTLVQAEDPAAQSRALTPQTRLGRKADGDFVPKTTTTIVIVFLWFDGELRV